jgi:putative transcriptional regulator
MTMRRGSRNQSGGDRPPDALRARVLAATEPGRGPEGFAPRLAELLDWSVEDALELIRAGIEPSGPAWRDGPSPEIRVRPLRAGPRHGVAIGGLVWCAPGVTFPEHLHHDEEWALILQGHARNSSGEHWSVGDLVHQPAGSAHSFLALEGPPLLAAVVVRRGFELV